MNAVRALAIAGLLVATVGLSACSHPRPTARLEIRTLDYTNEVCNDEVPVWFTVRSAGKDDSHGGQFRIHAGAENKTGILGLMAPGEEQTITVMLRLQDHCFTDDHYPLTLEVWSLNAPRVERDLALVI